MLRDYVLWSLLLRPQQATLGALVLVNREPVTAFGRLSADSFMELRRAVADAETALAACWHYDKINYLMLMMVDPDVHFHILPRYREPMVFAGQRFDDPGWPGPPALGHINAIDAEREAALIRAIRAALPPLTPASELL